MLNDVSSPLALLETRRSGKPRDMVAPGPDGAEVERMLRIATRVPDHGKLAPWRFVVIEDRDAFADLLARAYAVERPGAGRAELQANQEFARQAPTLIVALARIAAASKIPAREQLLSVGASVFALELAATAMGYVAGWLTGWAVASPAVLAAIGREGEEIVGFLFVGTPARALEERPRPALADVVARWPAG